MKNTPGIGERALVLFAAALLLYLLFFKHGVPIYLFNTNEGGVLLDEAYWILGGQVMYRDFFEYLTPGIVHFNAAVMWLFGPTASAMIWAYLAVGAALTGAFHALAARFVGFPWRLLPPALVLVLAYAPHSLGTHKWHAMLFAIAGLLILADGRSVGRMGSLLSGVMFGLSILFTQDLGVGIVAGAVAARLSEGEAGRRSAGWIAVGAGAVVALVLGGFALAAGAYRVFWDCVIFPLTRYSGPARGWVGLTYGGPTAGTQVGVCVAGLASAAALLSPRFTVAASASPARAPARLIVFPGLGLFAAIVHRTVPNVHPLGLALASMLLTVAMARAMELLWKSDGHRRFLSGALLLALAPGLLWGSVGLVLRRQLQQPLYAAHPRAGELWLREPMPELSWIERNARPDEPIFVFPFHSGVYFLTRTRNATSMPYLHEAVGFHTNGQIRQAADELQRGRPRVGVWMGNPDPGALAPLLAVVEQDYDGCTLPNGAIVFRRKDLEGPTCRWPAASRRR